MTETHLYAAAYNLTQLSKIPDITALPGGSLVGSQDHELPVECTVVTRSSAMEKPQARLQRKADIDNVVDKSKGVA